MPKAMLIVFSVPGIRRSDIDPVTTPTLYGWSKSGVVLDLIPTFPCVTSCVQASAWTGTPPQEHGVIANGFFHRDRNEVALWVGRNGVIDGSQVWDDVRDLGLTSAAWHGQNIKDAHADFIVTPEPIHDATGGTRLWCYSKPDGLYQGLVDRLGHFPLQHYWGPLAGLSSTRWILDAAADLAIKSAPDFHWIYIPHLDYASQKFGPDAPEARKSVQELDAELARFEQSIRNTAGDSVVFFLVGEYAMTPVNRVVYPNRLLREARRLRVQMDGESELLDIARSEAFAMVDHQLAHVFVGGAGSKKASAVHSCADLFRHDPGVAGVFAGAERRKIGQEHQRSGDVVLVAHADSWFAYPWWMDDAAAPKFARTVDIHRKPGYDPVELFFDPATRGIPLDAGLVKGSHGAPAITTAQRSVMVCSRAPRQALGSALRDVDIRRLSVDLLRDS